MAKKLKSSPAELARMDRYRKNRKLTHQRVEVFLSALPYAAIQRIHTGAWKADPKCTISKTVSAVLEYYDGVIQSKLSPGDPTLYMAGELSHPLAEAAKPLHSDVAA